MNKKSKSTVSRLKHRVTLQQEITASDSQGGYSRSWEDIAELWAEILPVEAAQSSESYTNGQLESVITHKILLRYRSGLTAAHRLMFGSRVFNIKNVINRSEKNDILELLVEEGAAG